MQLDEIKTAVVTFGLLAEAENVLARLYRECGKAGDETFWSDLAVQEEKHAANLTEMARLIAVSKGVGFEMTRQFPAAAVRSFIGYLEDHRAQVCAGGKSPAELYRIGRTIERAILDQRYPDIVKSNDISFNELMECIIRETETHLKALEEKGRRS